MKRRESLHWTFGLYVTANEPLMVETPPAAPKAVCRSLQSESEPGRFVACMFITQVIQNKRDTTILEQPISRWHGSSLSKF
jgi:hypothetical protein